MTEDLLYFLFQNVNFNNILNREYFSDFFSIILNQNLNPVSLLKIKMIRKLGKKMVIKNNNKIIFENTFYN